MFQTPDMLKLAIHCSLVKIKWPYKAESAASGFCCEFRTMKQTKLAALRHKRESLISQQRQPILVQDKGERMFWDRGLGEKESAGIVEP